MSNLSNVELEGGLKKIREGAFANCGLSKIKLPRTVVKIEDGALNGIKDITIYEKSIPGHETLLDICLNQKTFQGNSPFAGINGSIEGTIHHQQERLYTLNQTLKNGKYMCKRDMKSMICKSGAENILCKINNLIRK